MDTQLEDTLPTTQFQDTLPDTQFQIMGIETRTLGMEQEELLIAWNDGSPLHGLPDFPSDTGV